MLSEVRSGVGRDFRIDDIVVSSVTCLRMNEIYANLIFTRDMYWLLHTFLFLSRYVMFNILHLIFACAGASLLFAPFIDIHLRAVYTNQYIKVNIVYVHRDF